MARGGYRKPANPAPVSGPGALSRRTDGGPGSKQAMKEIRTGKYGESKEIAEQQAGAPMAGSPAPAPRVTIPTNQSAPTELFAPTERPDEPVTRGLPFGPGQNSLKSTSPLTSDSSAFAQKYLPSLKDAAYLPDAPDSFKRFVAYLEDMM
jgi:hypothetical protein